MLLRTVSRGDRLPSDRACREVMNEHRPGYCPDGGPLFAASLSAMSA